MLEGAPGAESIYGKFSHPHLVLREYMVFIPYILSTSLFTSFSLSLSLSLAFSLSRRRSEVVEPSFSGYDLS